MSVPQEEESWPRATPAERQIARATPAGKRTHRVAAAYLIIGPSPRNYQQSFYFALYQFVPGFAAFFRFCRVVVAMHRAFRRNPLTRL
jgi:hypothetical protein